MLFVDCNRHEIKFILSCRYVISFHFPTNRMAIWYRPPDELSRTFFCLLAVTYLWHHHNHIQVSLVVGDGLVHICNNLSNTARYRSVQCNDNGCFRLFYPPASVTSGGVLCMRNGVWAVKQTNVCLPLVTQLLRKHWDTWDDHWDVETLRSSRFTKRARTQILTFEFYM